MGLEAPLKSPWEVAKVLRIAEEDVMELAKGTGPMTPREHILFSRYNLECKHSILN